jgi:hypothetical protein
VRGAEHSIISCSFLCVCVCVLRIIFIQQFLLSSFWELDSHELLREFTNSLIGLFFYGPDMMFCWSEFSEVASQFM